jgi:hypothetical protein
MLSVDSFVKDTEKMRELIIEHNKNLGIDVPERNLLDHLDYSGGEPMMNCKWQDIITEGRRIFPE